jgi:uncharacterized repeat protein (TIGR01451 family)
MKKKMLLTMMALVLALSLGLVMAGPLGLATPVQAAGPWQLLYTTNNISFPSPAKVYEINVTTGTTKEIGTLTGVVTSGGSPNGNAWDPVNNRLYLSETDSKKLYFWDFSSATVNLAGTTTGTVAGAGFFNGAYYYIANGADDLRMVTFDGAGNIASDTLLKADFDGGVGANYYFGDVSIVDDGDDGILYGGAKVQPNDREHFFSIDLTSPGYTYTLIDSAWDGAHTQMAFGADGTLYAPRFGVWNSVDLTNGDLNTTGISTDATVRIPDLASGPVIEPSIDITKEADRECAYEGDTINYLYRVHNDGDYSVGPVVVFDSLPGVNPSPLLPDGTHNRGDLNKNGKLDPCETWYFRGSYTVPDPCDRPVIPNTATAYARTGHEPISAESNLVEVRILHPCIELEKWTTELAYFNGTEITYYYGVHNCGDDILRGPIVHDVTLEEDADPVLGRDGYNRGDVRNKGVFDPCETWYFSLDHTLVCRGITYRDFTNRAYALAWEPFVGSQIGARDMWKVRIFQWLPRTIGFWANWDNHIAVGDMRQLVADVDEQSTYFGLADPGPTAGGAVRNLLERIKGKMNADKAERMLAKQLLAAWLSVKSYENYGSYGDLNWAMNPNATVYIDTDGDGVPDTADGTVKELLYRIESAIGSMDKDGLLLAKDILEAMNSAESNHYVMFMPPDFDP